MISSKLYPDMIRLSLKILLLVSITGSSLENKHFNNKFGGLRRDNMGHIPYIYMHIAKTGGTTLSETIPIALGLGNFSSSSCNALYGIPKCCLNTRHLNARLKAIEWSIKCNFLSYEWPRARMETSFEPLLSNYRVLTSFREPLSHFFSACVHNAMHVRRFDLQSEPFVLHKAVAALKNGNKLPGHYDLRNFQTSFLVNRSVSVDTLRRGINPKVVLSQAKDYLKDIYWFSLSEHISLSLALLQCQVFGAVQPNLLAQAVLMPKLNSHFKSHEILNVTSLLLADIHDLISMDIYLYEAAVVEFWERIGVHRECLKNQTDLSDHSFY